MGFVVGIIGALGSVYFHIILAGIALAFFAIGTVRRKWLHTSVPGRIKFNRAGFITLGLAIIFCIAERGLFRLCPDPSVHLLP